MAPCWGGGWGSARLRARGSGGVAGIAPGPLQAAAEAGRAAQRFGAVPRRFDISAPPPGPGRAASRPAAATGPCRRLPPRAGGLAAAAAWGAQPWPEGVPGEGGAGAAGGRFSEGGGRRRREN